MNAARAIERLRAFRVRHREPATLGVEIDSLEASLRRAATAEGKAERAWRDLAPAALAARATSISLRRGILVIRARDSAARYEIDRWLRTGGGAGLLRACSARRAKIEP